MELAKGFRNNAGTPNPALAVNELRSGIESGRLVVIDQKLSEGHVLGLVEAIEAVG